MPRTRTSVVSRGASHHSLTQQTDGAPRHVRHPSSFNCGVRSPAGCRRRQPASRRPPVRWRRVASSLELCPPSPIVGPLERLSRPTTRSNSVSSFVASSWPSNASSRVRSTRSKSTKSSFSTRERRGSSGSSATWGTSRSPRESSGTNRPATGGIAGRAGDDEITAGLAWTLSGDCLVRPEPHRSCVVAPQGATPAPRVGRYVVT
jgi:hypothetical protein